MAAHISIRESIRWLPEEASEPTSTIVLTSPGRRFVDVRVYKEEILANDDKSPPMDLLPLPAIEWAIAGTSIESPTPPDPVDGHYHGKWTHWIDSRTEDCEHVADEGVMYPLPPSSSSSSSGERERVLEKGKMVNPATGLETEYEEIWVSEPITPDNRGDEFGEGGFKSTCGVIELVSDKDGAGKKNTLRKKGRVIRLGQYIQGIVREGGDVAVGRWLWDGNVWRAVIRATNKQEKPDAEGDDNGDVLRALEGAILYMTGDGVDDAGCKLGENEVGDEVRLPVVNGGRCEIWRIVEKVVKV